MSTLRIRDSYDWVVLGDHPGALLSGCLAARLGLSTLILPQTSTARVSISKTGQAIDFERNRLMGLAHSDSSSGLVWEILRHLGLKSAEEELLEHDPGPFQILAGPQRISFLRSSDEFLFELKRELSASASEPFARLSLLKSETLLSFWKSFPEALAATYEVKKTAPRKKTLRPEMTSLLKEWGRVDRAFANNDLWEAMGAALGNLVGVPEFKEWIHLYLLDQTSGAFRGGLTAYRDFLIRIAERTGAHILHGEGFNQVFVENGNLSAIQITHRGQVVQTRSAILGVHLESIQEKIAQSGKALKQPLKTPLSPVGWCFTLSILLREGGIPPGLQKYNLIQDAGAPPIEIEIADPNHYGMKQKSNRLLFLRTLLPFQSETLQVEYQRLLSARLLAAAARELPFLERSIESIHPEFRFRADGPGTEGDQLSKVYGFATLEMIPDNLRRYSGSGLGFESGLRGLYLATGESYPALGDFGPTVAAVEAIHQIAIQSNLSGALA